MPFLISVALGILSYELMITYMSIAEGVATPAAWVIFFLSLAAMENINPRKIFNTSIKLLTEKRKENNHKIKQLEDKVENLDNEVYELKKQLNAIQGKHGNEKTMEAELDFFKKEKNKLN